MTEAILLATLGACVIGLFIRMTNVELRLHEIERRYREFFDFKGDDGAPL